MTITFTHWITTAKQGLACLLALSMAQFASATVPYTPLPPTGPPILGPSVQTARSIPGKEYSHDFDLSTAGAGGVPDPEQVIAWDGIGGAADGLDYSFTRPNDTESQVDAIAHSRDTLYRALRVDRAHLAFSHDDRVTGYDAAGGIIPVAVPSFGPVALSNGNTIFGAGELSVERSGSLAPPESQSGWTKASLINAMPEPRDVDGVELWGPEPAISSNADKYSLDLDFETGTSVWNLSGSSYISHATIIGAVTSLLGAIPGTAILPNEDQEGRNTINLDALMVMDVVDTPDEFEQSPEGATDSILFSIRQILDPADPDGYYATGSEIFQLDAGLGASFLDHGGHLWDHDYSLTALRLVGLPNEVYSVIDINAIEAIGAARVPEPACATMLLLSALGLASIRRRRA